MKNIYKLACGLVLIGLLLLSGCVASEESKAEKRKYCESLNGQYYFHPGPVHVGHYCEIKTNEIWKTYYITKVNGVMGLEE